ncbi:MAG TPA: hypothetical protein VJR29_12945 [bacterium]|nr:hypothetical protein [bacterium]
MTHAEDWDRHLGKRVILIGTTQNQKLGAALSIDHRTVYVKGMDSWPPEFSNRMVRVIGILRQYDLPVAGQKDGAWSAGVAEPAKAYLMDKAKYDTEGCPPPE